MSKVLRICNECKDWLEKQRTEKPKFSLEQHVMRCPCECHHA